jgi:hypothetical protein
MSLGGKGVSEEIGNRSDVSHDIVRRVEMILKKASEN